MDRSSKLPVIGGRRKRKKVSDGQRALLSAIWRRYGGIREVAIKLNCHVQQPINWRNRGRVPLAHVMRVAEILNVSPWALNYLEMKYFYKNIETPPPWATVLNTSGLTQNEIQRITLLSEPE